MKEILVISILSLLLFGCTKQDKAIPETTVVKQEEIRLVEIATTISHRDIKFKGIELKTSKANILKIMGKPDSIVEPKYACGPFSEDWVGIPFYQYFYHHMNFIIYEDIGEIQDIELTDDMSIELNGISMNNKMTFDEISRLLKIESIPDYLPKSQIIFYPKENLDENYILEFKEGKLYQFDRFDPC